MKAIKISHYQMEAVSKVVQAIDNKQRRIAVEMVTGSGKSIVLLKVVEHLFENTDGKILIVTGNIALREQIEKLLFSDFKVIDNKRKRIDIRTAHYIDTHSDTDIDSYEFVLAYDIHLKGKTTAKLNEIHSTVIVFQSDMRQLIKGSDTVYEYRIINAVKDGIIAPVAEPDIMYDCAIEGFCERLLKKFNCKPTEKKMTSHDEFWNLCFANQSRNIWVHYNVYKSEDITPNAINTVLKNAVWNREKQKLSKDDIILLILFGNASGIDRTVLYSKFRIVVWDISNLIYYTINDKTLYKELSQLTYFPITDIEGEAAEGWNFTTITDSDVLEDLSIPTAEYINQLKACQSGTAHSREYEKNCESIIRYLFGEVFYHMSSQHKTKDTHFRMDLICSFRESSEEIHPFWRLLSQQYKTHFVVFEFKNYNEKIDQNLIYITEKYLFEPALRNIAIIVSRKGFSEAATFAAAGCLKENGKLILNITDEDLITMLEAKGNGDEPTTRLMEKFESFLMGISK